jgi:hypothetical protein
MLPGVAAAVWTPWCELPRARSQWYRIARGPCALAVAVAFVQVTLKPSYPGHKCQEGVEGAGVPLVSTWARGDRWPACGSSTSVRR